MRKTRPSKEELEKMYVDERMNAARIGERLGISSGTVRNWLIEYDIEIRDRSEAKLPKGFVKPSKEKLEKMYVDEGTSMNKIGEKLGISSVSVLNWLREYNIGTREARKLPEGFTKPSREELKKMYVDERISTYKIGKKVGVSHKTVNNWLIENEIEMRDLSEAKLPEGFTKPSREELERMYIDEGMSTTKIAKILDISDGSVGNWLREYKIPTRTNKYMSNPQFQDFLRSNKTALNLAGAALLMNNERSDMESFILQICQDTFKDNKELHSLLENNRLEIYSLIKEGLTNLGTYIGSYSLDDRAIIPVLIGQALNGIAVDKLTIPLEERVVKVLRKEYGPAFNDNPKETLNRLEKTIEQYEGKARDIYQRLYNHYQEVLQLQEELS